MMTLRGEILIPGGFVKGALALSLKEYFGNFGVFAIEFTSN